MNALDYRPKPPKPYERLPYSQQEQIKEYATEIGIEIAKQRETAYCRQVIELILKLDCISLHDSEGFGKHKLTRFLGNHKRVFNYHNRLVERGEQEEYLDRRMNEIFGEGGFPKDFVDNLLSQVELYEGDD